MKCRLKQKRENTKIQWEKYNCFRIFVFSCFRGKGFTLIEILLAIVIIVVIAGFSIPVYQNFQIRNDLVLAADITAQSLRRAQNLAQASDGNSDWGVKLDTGYITIFKGDKYTSRDSNFDEVFELSTNINPTSGIDEVVFFKFSGRPTVTGDIVLTSINGETKILTINEKGMIEY